MALLPGERIGRYEIVSAIGRGGMGEVYRAIDTGLKRQVAIKVLALDLIADSVRLARFQREAEILAAFNHPNIAAIYGLEDAGTSKALVLELIEGPTLGELIAQRAIPQTEALLIAKQIAEALELAHGQGIIHRDLKPANVKVRADGVVKVLDFGLAKAMEPAGVMPSSVAESPTITAHFDTQVGAIMGTAAYMSPEQARGQSVDKRTDIWAFGCVLYEMLTGRSPFARQTVADTLAAVVERDPDWTALPDTPTLTRLVKRCLQKELRRRQHEIADARIELEEALDSASRMQSVSLAEPAPVRGRGRVIVAISLAAVALAEIAIGVPIWRQRFLSMPNGVSPDIVTSRLTSFEGNESAAALSPDGRSFVFVSDHGGTPDIWLRQVSGGEPVRITNDSAEESDLTFTPDGESIYFTRSTGEGNEIWRVGVLGGSPRKVLENGWGPGLSPDGKSIAYVTRDTVGFALAVRSVDGGSARTLVPHLASGTMLPAWSPDGRSLAYSVAALFGPVDVFVLDAQTGEQRRVARLPLTAATNDGGHPVWLPDNRRLVISYLPLARQQAAADLGILDTRDGSILRLTATVGDGFYNPRLSADGSRLVATALHYRREIWKFPLDSDPDTNGRSGVRLIEEAAGPLWMFGSRDGRTVLFSGIASGSRNLWTLDLDRQASPHQITTVPGDAISHSSMSPDGTHVAFASIASGRSEIWTQHVDGTDLRQLTRDETAASWPVWSPDGQSIMYQTFRNERRETWRVRATGGPAEKLLDEGVRGDWIRQPHGNGTWIATSVTGRGTRLIDVEQRKVIWDRSVPGTDLSLPMFSGDGQFISAPFREARDHDVVRIFDITTGESRIAVRLPFHVSFRAAWTSDGRAVVVNRNDPVSHIVLFDHFREKP